MTSPKITIVLPTYNGSQFLEQSIESCLRQTFEDWELILVDDCSTDSTPQIIDAYSQRDARIRCVRHEKNRRLPASLNTGFAQAKGEYLTWTSDDNVYRPNALAEMLALLEQLPEVGMVYAGYTIIDERGCDIRPVSAGDPLKLLEGNNVVGGCFLYRRHVLEIVGPYAEDLFLAEDYDYWLRISRQFKLQPLQRDLYQYRQHAKTLTAAAGNRAMQVLYQSLERNLPGITWAGRHALAKGYVWAAYARRKNGEHLTPLKLLGKAMRHSILFIANPIYLGMVVEILFGSAVFRLVQRGYWLLAK